MRIAYVAKHGSGGNDDEGAIAHALEHLGHTVLKLPESISRVPEADLLLFHKWHNPDVLKAARCRKAFWYFDLVDWAECAARSAARREWMKATVPLVDAGFCTDGDWCKVTGLRWLAQGADGRHAIHWPVQDQTTDLLFTGNASGGAGRSVWVGAMRHRYGGRFVHHKAGLHGTALAKAIDSARIVLAPDAPVTDLYWSNRVYLTLGYGGFLLHPACSRLRSHYRPAELVMYSSLNELHELIGKLLLDRATRYEVARAGYERTVKEHLYVHRCAQLMEMLE